MRKSPMWVLVAAVYLTMLVFGLVENVKGVAFPLLKLEFGTGYGNQGGLLSVTWYGYVIFCMVATLVVSRWGGKAALLAGFGCVAAGSVLTWTAPSFLLATLTLMLVHAGFGFFEVGTNAVATASFTRRSALLMNLLHFFYGLGAVIGPWLAGRLTGGAGIVLSWRQLYLAVALGTVLLGIAMYLMIPRRLGAEQSEKTSIRSALRSPLVWLFALTLGFMEIIEFGAANWGGLYFQDVYGLDVRTTGALFVSAYYVLFTASRLISGFAIEKIGYIRSLMISLAAVLVLFIAGFSLGAGGLWVLPASGFFVGLMWPTIMAVAMGVFKEQAPVMTSAIITISGAINGLGQLVIGFTNNYIGIEWGYRSCTVYAVAALALFCVLRARIRKGENALAA